MIDNNEHQHTRRWSPRRREKKFIDEKFIVRAVSSGERRKRRRRWAEASEEPKNVLKVTRCAYDHLSFACRNIFVVHLFIYYITSVLTFHEIMLFMNFRVWTMRALVRSLLVPVIAHWRIDEHISSLNSMSNQGKFSVNAPIISSPLPLKPTKIS